MPIDAPIGNGPRCSPTNGVVAERLEDALAPWRGLVGVGLGQDHGELVAAVAGRDVRARSVERISSAVDAAPGRRRGGRTCR